MHLRLAPTGIWKNVNEGQPTLHLVFNSDPAVDPSLNDISTFNVSRGGVFPADADLVREVAFRANHVDCWCGAGIYRELRRGCLVFEGYELYRRPSIPSRVALGVWLDLRLLILVRRHN